MGGSFAAGIFEPELQAGLPDRLAIFRPGGEGRELDPLSTYNRVLEQVYGKFYGELPKDLNNPKDPKLTPERLLTFSAIRGLLSALDDPYTRFLDPTEYRSLREENEGSFVGIGAQLDGEPTKDGFIRINRPIPDTPAQKAGVKKGDLITHVDGKSIQGMKVDQVVKLIRGQEGTVVRLTVKRMGQAQPKEFAITRQAVQFRVVESRMEAGNIGYVSLAQFNEMADPRLESAIRELEQKGMKGLVLDLRGNPGGLLDAAIDISSRFVPAKKKVVIIVQSQDKDERTAVQRKFMGGRWPLVVLVNQTSASASEIVAGAIKDNDAGTVVGTTTFGKGLVQTVVPLQDGSASMITTAKYLTPSGKDINRSREQRGGVEPDVRVEVTEEQFFKNEDPQLKKGIEILRQQLSGQIPPKPSTANVPNRAASAPK